MENCPYCNVEIEIDHDDGYGYQEDEVCFQSCNSCGKEFSFTTSVIYYYELNKCPCKNGKPHELEQIIGYPSAFFVGKKRCSYCDEEFMVDESAHKAAIERYYNPIND